MNKPVLCYYGLFEDATAGKTPKYRLTANAGKIAPVEALRGRDGSISVYYVSSRHNSGKPDAPRMRLQAAHSLNLTGLRYLRNVSGCAYGWPETGADYGKGIMRANPFNNSSYAFVFIFHGTISDNRPEYDRRPCSFEWLVFKSDNPKADAARLCRSLAVPAGATLSLLEQIRGMRANIAPQPLL